MQHPRPRGWAFASGNAGTGRSVRVESGGCRSGEVHRPSLAGVFEGRRKVGRASQERHARASAATVSTATVRAVKRQIRASVVVLVLAVLLTAGVVERASHSVPNAMTLAAVGLVLVAGFGWWSLRSGRHTPWDVAEGLLNQGQAVVLWKPGCPYCERLLRALGRDERITWVNVWKDEEANSVVRQLNSGDEYVPTVIVGSEVLPNPNPHMVLSHLSDR